MKSLFLFASFAVLAVPRVALAQAAPLRTMSSDILVTADARPVDAESLSVSATVITREEIDRRKATSVLDLLRTVPGLDVVQSGGPGGVTSLFLRGTSSTQTLVLVDGVRINSPFFGGVDLSSVSTASIERIEVVRGPFSALYGSEAVGGVIQILTRRAPKTGVTVHGRGAIGNLKSREAEATVSYAGGPVDVTASWNRRTTDGLDLPNSAYDVTNLAGGFHVNLTDDLRVGAIVRNDRATAGVPFSGSTPSPLRKTTVDTTTIAVPISLRLGAATTVEVQGIYAKDEPTFDDPEGSFGYTHSDSQARRAGGRFSLGHVAGAHRLSLGTDYERVTVTSRDSYGTNLDGESLHTFSVFAEDRISVLKDRLDVTAGVRWDDHSAFGSHVSPRLTAAYRAGASWKLRASVGGAFRSPTTGELFFPFSGNPELKPETSVAYELGAEWKVLPRLVVEMALFRNDIQELIQYDFVSNTNQNVGRARTQGVELVVRGELTDTLFVRASATRLDAEDRATGEQLLRRPKNRASLTFGGKVLDTASFELTAMYVGSRRDVDAATFATVTNPSHVRFDLSVTGPKFFDVVAPYARAANLFDRDYQEVAGYPTPGRRVSFGLEVNF